jgi:3-deoxy-7-phosphoheptulonate synthase
VEPLIVLDEAGKHAGIPEATEVVHPPDVDRAVARVDVLVVSAAQMQNEALLREVGRVDRPVILERAMMASLEEWLLAAERILERGNHRLILCERGIRTFERATTSTLDLSALVVLRERSHLPVFVDPFRATGNARWAMPLAEGARGAGAQGLVISVAATEQGDASELAGAQLEGFIQRLRQLG